MRGIARVVPGPFVLPSVRGEPAADFLWRGDAGWGLGNIGGGRGMYAGVLVRGGVWIKRCLGGIACVGSRPVGLYSGGVHEKISAIFVVRRLRLSEAVGSGQACAGAFVLTVGMLA